MYLSVKRPHFCHGTVPFGGETVLFYVVDKNAKTGRFLDPPSASADDVKFLSEACQAATFGRDDEDIRDESYRQAGTMDMSDFLTTFNLNKHRIMDLVREQLLDWEQQTRVIKAESHKLNVYVVQGHSQERKHVRILVVVFPTAHVGRGLLLRHDDTEWTFDSSSLLQSQETPSIAYVAFFSDVDLEVVLVESGYRVTVTYNLYLEEAPPPGREEDSDPVFKDTTLVVAPADAFKDAIAAALSALSFLPAGGTLGLGLSFIYSINTTGQDSKSLGIEAIATRLKGSDGPIISTTSLGPQPSLKGIYTENAAQ